MTLAHAIKDYTEILVNLFPPDKIISITDLFPSFIVFVGNSVKFVIIYIFSFEWLKTLIYLPIKIPELTSQILTEHLVFDQEQISALSINFIPEQMTQLIPKLITGFLNGLVMALPFTTPQIIALRQTLFKGKYAGLASFSGLILGKLVFISCILFGIRWIILPWIDLQAWNYLLGVGLILFCLLKSLNEVPDPNWGLQRIGNPFIDTMLATKDKIELKQVRLLILRKMFFFQFLLAWTEQNALFSYLQGTHFDLSSSFLDIVVFENESIIGTHVSYLIGLSLGLCLGTLFVCLAILRIWRLFLTQAELFFIPPEDFRYDVVNLTYVTPKIQRAHEEFWQSLLTKLGDFFLKYRFPKKMSGPYLHLQFKRFFDASRSFFLYREVDYMDEYRKDNTGLTIVAKTVYVSNYFFCLWLLTVSLSTFSYYGIDNFIHYSLGFTPEDKALTYTRPKTYMTALKEAYNMNDQTVSTFNGSLLDRENYLFFPYRQDVPFIPIESWIARDSNRLASMEESEDATESPLRESHSRRYMLKRKKNFFKNSQVTTTWPQSASHWFFKYDSPKERSAIKRSNRPAPKTLPTFAFDKNKVDEFIEKDAFPRITNASFQWEFLNYDQPTVFEDFIRSQYYTNPIFTNLLKGKMDKFIAQQPNRYNLKITDEKQLFENRLALAHYYDTLRDYQIAVDHNLSLKEINSQQEPGSTLPITRSLANRVYNQQFSGTLGPMRRLFALEYDFNQAVTFDQVPKRNWEEANKTPFEFNGTKTDRVNPSSSLVFQFDQPLYNENQNIPDLIRHESLDDDYLEPFSNQAIEPIQIPFLKPQASKPMFIGWDEELEKIVITDRYLSSSVQLEDQLRRIQGFPSGWLFSKNPILKKAESETSMSSTSEAEPLLGVSMSTDRKQDEDMKTLLEKVTRGTSTTEKRVKGKMKIKTKPSKPTQLDMENYLQSISMDSHIPEEIERMQLQTKIDLLGYFKESLLGPIEDKKAADGLILRQHFRTDWHANPGEVDKKGYQAFEFTRWPLMDFSTRKIHRHYVLPWVTFPSSTDEELDRITDVFGYSLDDNIPVPEDVIEEVGLGLNPIPHPPNAAFSFAFSRGHIRETANEVHANPIAILPPTTGGFFWSGNPLKFGISELTEAKRMFTEYFLEPTEDTISADELKDLPVNSPRPKYYNSDTAQEEYQDFNAGRQLPGLIPHREQKELGGGLSAKNVKKGLSIQDSFRKIFSDLKKDDKEIGDEF